MLYDVHCHMTDNAFKMDRQEVIDECEKNGIVLITNGLNLDDNKRVLDLSSKSTYVHASLGYYPSFEYDEEIVSHAEDNAAKIVAIGEVGLDYTYGNKKLQKERFKAMLDLAERISKPLIVHSRKAERDVLDAVKEVGAPVVLHAFLAKRSLVKEALEMNNIYFSISSIARYSEQVRDVIRMVPAERMFCETDSPYMWKFGRNTPLNVRFAYKAIADIKKLSMEEVEILIAENVEKVFGIVY